MNRWTITKRRIRKVSFNQQCHRLRGFTLIELVLLISVLGIMVVLYTESAGNLSDIAVDAASRKAQSDIRYAQLLAKTTGVKHGVKFNKGGSYEVYVNTPASPATDPVTHQQFVEDLSKYPGVTITTAYQVEFEPTVGRPTMGGDHRVRFTASSGAIRDVYVVDQTGAVVVDLIERGTGCSCDLCSNGI